MAKTVGRTFAIIDLAHGDCGKALVAAWFLLKYKIRFSIRFQGGSNAGHTTEHNGVKRVTNLVPIACLFGGIGAIGQNCVILPFTPKGSAEGIAQRRGFRGEVEDLGASGLIIGPDNLIIDEHAAVTIDPFLEREACGESGGNKIGSTCRGITQTYESIAGKYRITVADCLRKDRLRSALSRVVEHYSIDPPALEEIIDELLEWGVWLQSTAKICSVTAWRNEIEERGEDVLLEGAQGMHLDVLEHQPFSTSSCMWPPQGIGRCRNFVVVGVFKSIPSRVGDGPFLTEMAEDDKTIALRKQLGEFGATTGRPRRLGMPDAISLRHSLERLNPDILVMTRGDSLTGVKGLKVAIEMKIDGQVANWWASIWDVWMRDTQGQVNPDRVRISWVNLPFVRGNNQGVTHADELSQSLREWLADMESAIGRKIDMVKTGPSVQDMCVRNGGAMPEMKHGVAAK